MSLVVGGVVPTEDVVGRVRESNEVLASLPHSGAVLVGDRRHGKTSLSRLVQRMAADQGAVVVSVSAERETYAEFVSALISELAPAGPVLGEGTRQDPAHPHRRSRPARTRQPRGGDVGRPARPCDPPRTGPHPGVVHRRGERAGPQPGARRARLRRHLPAPASPGPSGESGQGRDGAVRIDRVPPRLRGRAQHRQRHPQDRCRAHPLRPCDLPRRVPAAGQRHAHHRPARRRAAIAAAAENVPYYIQHLVAAARKSSHDTQVPPYPELIDLLVLDAIENPYDPWDLRHYRDRLPHYYGAGCPRHRRAARHLRPRRTGRWTSTPR